MNARRLTLMAPLVLATLLLAGITSLLTAAGSLAATPPPAVVSEAWSTNVAPTSATLNAAIDPGGAPASYYFQYSTADTSACIPSICTAIPAAPGEAIGSGEGNVTVPFRHIQGLAEGKVYHYRAVAVSEPEPGVFATVDGPDQTFTTQTVGGPLLPDGRAWELVSPPNKHGSLIEAIGQEGIIQAAADGDAIAYHANAPFTAETAGYTNEQQVISARGAGGWETRDIGIPHPGATGKSEGRGEDYRYFSSDLSQAIVQPAGAFTPLSPEASEQTPYARSTFSSETQSVLCSGSCFTPLVTGCPPVGQACAGPIEGNADVPRGTVFGQFGEGGGEVGPCPSVSAVCGPLFEGASPDGDHVVLSTTTLPGHATDLTSTSAPEGGLYEWNAGELSLVSLLPKSEGEAPGEKPVLGAGNVDTRGAVSASGTRIFWLSNGEATHLYMRDTTRGETFELDSGLPGVPRFQAATPDGSKVFFTEEGALYECDIVEAAGDLTCIRTLISEEVQGSVIGISEDGSWVYFVANSVLAEDASQGSCSESVPSPSETCSLYARHNGETKLVAALSDADSATWGKEAGPGDLHQLTARVSPNGEWLAFMSQRPLPTQDDPAGYDNIDANSPQGHPNPDEEVYLYDAAHSELHCPSCNPTGERPQGELYGEAAKLVGGNTVWPAETMLAASIPGWTPYQNGVADYQSRYLSNEGRLFFNSHDSLVPQDVNGTWDVYEYEPPGVPAGEAACTASADAFSARAGGCVGLISSGSSSGESAFLDASESGRDVFFLTLSKLSPQDFDTSYDVYDAHECTGASPCRTSAVSPPACVTAEECRAAYPAQPAIFGAPPSTTFSSNGNVQAPPTLSKPAVKPKSLTRAQKLAAALKACRADLNKHKRMACESRAHKRYGPVKPRKSTKAKRGSK